MSYLAGIDIGGTKCAVTLGKTAEGGVEILHKKKFLTLTDPYETINKMVNILTGILEEYPQIELSAIGISCGGPMNSKKGLILSPPNLPGWDKIDVVSPFKEGFCVPTAVQNDANASGLAEWMWGAGRGTNNMIFLTFGTGLGAGLILDGRLYTGTNDMAGEVGHIRLAEDGPVGFGKKGSFEGFCSGGGIAQFAKEMVREWEANGNTTLIRQYLGNRMLDALTTVDVGLAAQEQDKLAVWILQKAGENLGKGLAVLIDILNPEKIVIGGVFLRQESIMRDSMEAMITKESLAHSNAVCEVVPAGLGEQIGDYAALSVARSLL